MREAEYKILVVDDEPEIEAMVRQRVHREIRSQKYEFAFVRGGIEAIDALSADDEIDRVLTDIDMPRMDGFAPLQRIFETDSDVRSVIISAYGDMSNIRIAMNRGAFDFADAAPDNPVSSFADGAAQSDDNTCSTLRRS
ncbi:MAG: response regulator [Chloroflexi bacterium]|nr:response regulator [Chloroflexota bacterium]